MFGQLRTAFSSIQSYAGSFTSTRSASMLSSLSPPKNSKSRVRRLGRGPGSGLGKTSGRGQKGQKARGSIPNWFEGGQTPLYKLFPKRGFFRHQQLELNDISLMRIQQFYDQGKIPLAEGEVLTMRKMKEFGIVTGSMKDGISIVGTGKQIYTAPIAIEATKATGPAIEAIERAGGKFTAKYFSRSLGYKAHHAPNWFIQTKGYLPNQALPIARRDILNYSNPEKNGYLVGSEYIEKINNSLNNIRTNKAKVSKAKTGTLADQLLNLDISADQSRSQAYKGFKENKIVSFEDFKKSL